MSGEAIRNAAVRMVLAYLLFEAERLGGNPGLAFDFSCDELADALGIGDKTVRRALRSLERLGIAGGEPARRGYRIKLLCPIGADFLPWLWRAVELIRNDNFDIQMSTHNQAIENMPDVNPNVHPHAPVEALRYKALTGADGPPMSTHIPGGSEGAGIGANVHPQPSSPPFPLPPPYHTQYHQHKNYLSESDSESDSEARVVRAGQGVGRPEQLDLIPRPVKAEPVVAGEAEVAAFFSAMENEQWNALHSNARWIRAMLEAYPDPAWVMSEIGRYRQWWIENPKKRRQNLAASVGTWLRSEARKIDRERRRSAGGPSAFRVPAEPGKYEGFGVVRSAYE